MARYCAVAIILQKTPPTVHKSDGVCNNYNCKSLTFDLALGNSWSVGRSLKDNGTLSGCLFTENDSHIALCKGVCVMLSPIRATRPRGRVASSLGNSLAAAMLDYRKIGVSCRTEWNLPCANARLILCTLCWCSLLPYSSRNLMGTYMQTDAIKRNKKKNGNDGVTSVLEPRAFLLNNSKLLPLLLTKTKHLMLVKEWSAVKGTTNKKREARLIEQWKKFICIYIFVVHFENLLCHPSVTSCLSGAPPPGSALGDHKLAQKLGCHNLVPVVEKEHLENSQLRSNHTRRDLTP